MRLAAKVLGYLIDRRQAGTTGHTDNMRILRGLDRYAMRPPQIDFVPRRQVVTLSRKFADVDDRQTDGIMGQAGERLFPDARYPHEYVLARPDIEFAVECDHGDVLADNVIGRHSVGLESHVDVKAHLLACLISAGSEVVIQIGKKATDVLGIHAGQPGSHAKNCRSTVCGGSAVGGRG